MSQQSCRNRLQRLVLGCAGILLAPACGGGLRPKQPGAMPPEVTHGAISAFALIERFHAHPKALPGWVRPETSPIDQVAFPSGNGVTSRSTLKSDGSMNVTLTFSCASPSDDSTLSGEIGYTFARGTGNYLVEYRSLKLVQGTTSWTINGTKQIQLHRFARQATISTPTPMTVAILDTKTPSSKQTYSYDCRLSSEYRTAGIYRLWGRFSFQTAVDPVLKGEITPGEALLWNSGDKCCYPGSGKLKLTQGFLTREALFSLPCGTYSMPGSQKQEYKFPSCCN